MVSVGPKLERVCAVNQAQHCPPICIRSGVRAGTPAATGDSLIQSRDPDVRYFQVALLPVLAADISMPQAGFKQHFGIERMGVITLQIPVTLKIDHTQALPNFPGIADRMSPSRS